MWFCFAEKRTQPIIYVNLCSILKSTSRKWMVFHFRAFRSNATHQCRSRGGPLVTDCLKRFESPLVMFYKFIFVMIELLVVCTSAYLLQVRQAKDFQYRAIHVTKPLN